MRKEAGPFLILVINPGSTSTKIALYRDLEPVFDETVRHSAQDLSRFARIADQLEFRFAMIQEALERYRDSYRKIHAVVGRGGLLAPVEGGVYEVTDAMLQDLREARYGQHASNLGGILAQRWAEHLKVKAYIVDPVVVDEMEPVARISGMPEMERISIFHALNQKSVARQAAEDLGKSYADLNLIVVHLGGGISVGVHKKGRVVDVNNALNGEGPFSPERSGGLPAGQLVDLCYSGRFTHSQMLRKLTGAGGLVAYLGTQDMLEVRRRISSGDAHAAQVVDAMAYQIAKEIGACSTVLEGRVDAVVITGGLAQDEQLVGDLKGRIAWIAPVLVYAGEREMLALAQGCLAVLTGREPAGKYQASLGH
ncbi:butyrate kinase [bacterium]|nr:butyrate kinase [bacterium]